jgi:hypothetical protein
VLLSDSLARHGGVRLGSEGDSLFVGFERVSGALRAAVDGQLALARHRWRADSPVRARMGVPVERLKHVTLSIADAVSARRSDCNSSGERDALRDLCDLCLGNYQREDIEGGHPVTPAAEP